KVPTTGTFDSRLLLLILLLTAISVAITYLILTGWSGIAASAVALTMLITVWMIFFLRAGIER
ncbi:MAG: hypothetical protein LUO82_07005, partial [Methanomicrobiales archaeon]|nr:hypothetical protein [Methanomicrobiales archaeon]